jgi:NitT/TauT family transport system substrate-binding protein
VKISVIKNFFILLIFFSLNSCARKDSFNGNLRLGYLLNMSHAVAIVGIEGGAFTNIEPHHFSSGSSLLDGFLTGNIDIAYIGPGPYINALNKGVQLRLLSQSAIGGNSLIVRPEYNPEKPYVIKNVAIPQYGNTQDLLAKILINKISAHNKLIDSTHSMIQEIASNTSLRFDKDFAYVAVNPAELETAFFIKAVDSALVPEPWGTTLTQKGFIDLSKLLVGDSVSIADELVGVVDLTLRQQLAYINEFPATILVVREDFYKQHRDLVDQFVDEQNQVLSEIQAKPEGAIMLIKQHLEKQTKKNFDYDFLVESFKKVKFDDHINQEFFNELARAGFKANYYRRLTEFEFTRK